MNAVSSAELVDENASNALLVGSQNLHALNPLTHAPQSSRCARLERNVQYATLVGMPLHHSSDD